ncbi:sugar ABC transporter substrate-binding protein [Desulforhopalus sp. 52FAK]
MSAYVIKHIVILLFTSLLLTSCDNSPEPSTTVKKDVQEQGSHVTLMIHTSHLGAADEMARLFYEETGNVVRIISAEYHEIYEATLNDFNSPSPQADVYVFWYANLARLAEERVISPLDHFYKKNAEIIDVDDLIPHYFDRYTLYRGKRWAVPFDGDIHVLFYRKSLFAKYDLSPPSTWSQYLEIVKFITEKEKKNNIYGAAFMAYPTPFLIVGSFLNRLGGFGGTMEDDNMQPRIYSPEAVRALEAMVEHSKYTFPSTLEVDFAVARDAFIQGKVGMVEQWTDVGIMAEDPRQSLIRGDWGVVPMPVEQDIGSSGLAPLNAGWSLGISSKSKQRDLAEQLLLFAIRKDITLKLNLIPGGGGHDPTRISTINNMEFQEFAPQVSEVEKQLLDGTFVAFPNHPAVPDLLVNITDALVAALEGRMSPDEALKQCQLKWDVELEKWPEAH